jgi:hypothetical protein
MVDSGANPTGGATPFRSNSNETTFSASGGGQTRFVTSDDSPNFGPYKIVHSSTTWTTTQGGYDFTEFIVGYSSTFPLTYVVAARANWTIRFIGNRNSSNGTWTNNGSTVTLQGSAQQSANFTTTVSGGAPQTGNSAVIQVRGNSFALSHTPVYNP